MSYELIGITVLWTFLLGYIIIGSVDFGAGFFSYYSTITGHHNHIHHIIQRYLSPVWEVTNVFLIFFVVGLIGFFPDVAYYYGTALLIPGSLVIVLLSIRGAYYAYSTYGATPDRKAYMFLYGGTGLLIPAALSTVLAISEGGFINQVNGKIELHWSALLCNGFTWSVVLLALVSVLYISAMFLTYYAARAKDEAALKIVRGYALMWSGPTIIASLLAFYTIRDQNAQHFTGMLELWWMFLVSILCFTAAVYLVWKQKNYGLAFTLVVFQFGFAVFGYGISHLPYILYPFINIKDQVTSEPMALGLVIVFVAGLVVLIPSLYLLLKLFLFDADYVEGKNKGKEEPKWINF